MGKIFIVILLFPFILLGNSIKIGFGSCFNQNLSYDIWSLLQKEKLDYFIFLGDNVYIDKESSYEDAYKKLFGNFLFQTFFQNTHILTTWDDHDYGKNDAGKEFNDKILTKNLFLHYWYKNKYPELYKKISQQEGIYHSYELKLNNKKIIILLLDTRWFRDPLKEDIINSSYIPDYNPKKTLLGHKQWQWLEKELQKRIDLIILGSSIQVIPENHRFEKWNNFPLEKNYLIKLIKKYNLKNIIIISGDRHFSEVSKQNIKLNDHTIFSLYEFTSSSLNQELPSLLQKEILKEKNTYRMGGPFLQSNYGIINIQVDSDILRLIISIKNYKGEELFTILRIF
jgi:alkaline phosphatase D